MSASNNPLEDHSSNECQPNNYINVDNQTQSPESITPRASNAPLSPQIILDLTGIPDVQEDQITHSQANSRPVEEPTIIDMVNDDNDDDDDDDDDDDNDDDVQEISRSSSLSSYLSDSSSSIIMDDSAIDSTPPLTPSVDYLYTPRGSSLFEPFSLYALQHNIRLLRRGNFFRTVFDGSEDTNVNDVLSGDSSDDDKREKDDDGNESKKDENRKISKYDCPICLEPPSHPVSTMCGHVFCRKCMRELFRKCNSSCQCPICKKPISRSQIHPLYL